MSKFKKLLSWVLVVALTAGVSITGTMAYLTSEDSNVNVMTLGDVQIEQHEYQRAANEDGSLKTDTIDEKTSYVLEDFEQAKPLLPVITNPGTEGSGWDSTTVRMSQVNSYGGMNVFSTPNAQDKFVTVENSGKNDVYVRTLVAFEIGSGNEELIGFSHRGATSSSDTISPWVMTKIGIIQVGGNNYNVYEFLYRGASDVNRHVNGKLPAGETTYPSLAQVYLRSEATNEDCVALDGNKNGTYDILVLSQAVQTAGFADAATALETAFPKGENNVNVPGWFEGMIDVTGTVENTETQNYAAGVQMGEYKVYNNAEIVSSAGGLNIQGTAVFNSGSVETGNFNGPRHVFYVAAREGKAEGHLTINGGEFTFSPDNLTRKGSYLCADGGVIIVNDGKFNKPSTRTAPIQAINGGSVTIYGGTFAFDPSAFVAEGYQAIESNGWWTVSAK